MNSVARLIQELCPDGVVYKALGSLGRRNHGTQITASRMKELAEKPGPLRIFGGGETIADVQASSIPPKDIITEPSIIVKSRGHIGFTYYENPFSHKSELWSYTILNPTINQKFVYYYLLTKVNDLQRLAASTSVKLPQLSVKDTDSLNIPIPPLTIQNRIVDILDSFTSIEKELEKELEKESSARQRQYAYYRDSLFINEFKTGSTIPLGRLGTFIRGQGLQKKDFTSIGHSCIHYGQIYTDYDIETTTTKSFIENSLATKLRQAQPGDLVIATTSENDNDVCKAVAWMGKENAAISGDAYIFRHRLNPLYAAFLFSSSIFQKQKLRFITGTKVRRVSGESMAKIVVPVPSLKKQTDIALILKKLNSLVKSSTKSLLDEIKARQKQYMYYRDQLLTFEELHP